MAGLTLGTNCGFCSTSPTTDPDCGSTLDIDNKGRVVKDTSPSGATTITEVGFYCPSNDGTERDYSVVLYDDGGVDGIADDRLEYTSPLTNTVSTGVGWKVQTGLNWSISASTAYWFGCFVAYSSGAGIKMDYDNAADWALERGYVNETYAQSDDPWSGGGFFTTNNAYAVFAKVTVSATGNDVKINIGDSWKTMDAMKVNIGDSWKVVEGAQINIGDSWKTIF